MPVPSIKGAVIRTLFEDLLHHLETGSITQEKLEAELSEADLQFLRAKVDIGRWYPLGTYERCTRLLCETEGGDEEALLRSRGRLAGQRLTDSGLYPQLELADRMSEERLNERLLSDVRLMASVFGSMLSVGELAACQNDEGELRLEVRGADELPEVLAPVILGMVNYLAERIGDSRPYHLERPERGLWVYTR